MSIAVIAGLGNPGLGYRNTRHNIGFDVVDQLALRAGAGWKREARLDAEIAAIHHAERKIMLVKPTTYMNGSGRSLAAVLRYRQLEPRNLLIIYDDITLTLGRAKLSHSGSAGGHNGVSDILDRVGGGFNRYRIGIGAKPNKEMDLADYVLSKFSNDEKSLLADRMPSFLEHLALILEEGIDPAMNIINQRPVSEHERNNH
ncbi:aminoacyl-tRNA hydrolase [Coraliomargarita akajimensis]|uniref:Peptidyl-tRNA hydrolase n=1 Tax=Coraliomargarita akajimensis (strain DSM 45221 / IAM 15411 / JCM 23193 / KCTC 12865 / 04OKA010-24) TaxID=583355 RepID=D5EJK8_CORAD|nr:aminoacyl-tRNA hydrolase [Coraliomargarita akajimensis]ADE54607.1 peptidyl-tRNA hydrolase [Coraliomargarita akajimensis DSM 45221]